MKVIALKKPASKEATLCAASFLSIATDTKTSVKEARTLVIASLKLLRPLTKQHWWAYGVTELLTDALRAYARGSSHHGDFWDYVEFAAEKVEEAYKKCD
jgi:hypothetical protein